MKFSDIEVGKVYQIREPSRRQYASDKPEFGVVTRKGLHREHWQTWSHKPERYIEATLPHHEGKYIEFAPYDPRVDAIPAAAIRRAEKRRDDRRSRGLYGAVGSGFGYGLSRVFHGIESAESVLKEHFDSRREAARVAKEARELSDRIARLSARVTKLLSQRGIEASASHSGTIRIYEEASFVKLVELLENAQ